MTVREDKMGQSLLLPPSLRDLVPDDHICHLVIEVVNSMDKEIEKAEEKFQGPGNPAYSRKMLLRVVVQAGVDSIFPSRKIAKLVEENVIYMYLAGNERPDFRTICSFRRNEKELIEKAFHRTVALAKAVGILNFHLSTDGTKLKANASNNYSLSEEELEWIREVIDKGIEVDEEEDEMYGDKRGDELPPELTREELNRKIKEMEEERGKEFKRARKVVEQYADGDEADRERIEGKLDKARQELEESGQDAVSFTDPEARFMENKKKRKELSYNPQVTVDESGIIVAQDVTQDCTDHDQLQPMVEKTEESLGSLRGVKMSFDNGYFKGENLRYLEEKGIDAYIPDCRQAQEAKGKLKDSPFSKDKFEYDEDRDCFICPQGRVLTRKGTYNRDGKVQYAYYGSCKGCPHKEECTGKKTRVILSDEFEAERRRMAAKMESEEGKEEYRKRKESERTFGDIKQNMGLREFLTRGIKNVKTEWSITCTAHNLKVMWNKWEDKADLLAKIEGLMGNFYQFLLSKPIYGGLPPVLPPIRSTV